jgi:hypothetical protein
METTKKYEWNEETVDYFAFTSCYISREDIHQLIVNFVDLECQLEDGDCEEDMVTDLMSKVYTDE